jgi:hypothetical protein
MPTHAIVGQDGIVPDENLPEIPSPALSVIAENTYGIAPSIGELTRYARQDHTHGTPPDPISVAIVMSVALS